MKGMKEMKKMKKLISAVAATAMFLGTIPMAIATETSAWADLKSELNANAVHIGVIADTHVIGENDNDNMTAAFNAFNDLTDGGLSGVILNGDIIYQYDGNDTSTTVSADPYTYVFNAMESVFGTDYEQYIWSMGNHEFPQATSDETLTSTALKYFKENVLGSENADPNYTMEFDGYTVIAAAAQNYYGVYSEETESWILEQIDAAVAESEDKPIFLAMHHPLQGRIMNYNVTSCSDSFIESLKAYPQVINISSHEHIMAQQPAAIRQDGFTSIMTPYLGEIGNINAEGAKSQPDVVAQALMIEIDRENVVKIYKLDVKNNKFIGNPYVIDIPALVSGDETAYLYTDARKDNSNTPVFPENAAVTVSNITGTGATISFPQATNTAQSEAIEDGFVLYYNADITNAITGASIGTQKIASGYHLVSDFADMPETVSQTITIPSGVTCKVTVSPVAPFGKVGAAITSETFTTLRDGEIPSDGSILTLIPNKDNKFMVGTTGLGTESVGAWGYFDAEYEVYAPEDGWYDVGVRATGINATSVLKIFANTEYAGKVTALKTLENDKYFENQVDYWGEAGSETFTDGYDGASRTVTYNGHVWLAKGTNCIRLNDSDNACGMALHKILFKKTLDCTDTPPTYHYYDMIKYDLAYNLGENYKTYTQDDNSGNVYARKKGVTTQGTNVVRWLPWKANYKVCAPVSGYYNIKVRGGNGLESDVPFNVFVNSSKTADATGVIATTAGSFTKYKTNDFGQIYLNKGINLITINQNSKNATYAKGFSLELAEEKQLDISKYTAFSMNAAAYNILDGTKIPVTGWNDSLNMGGGTSIEFIVNATEAGYYNIMTTRSTSGSANQFTVTVNGEKQLTTLTPTPSDAWVSSEVKLGKVYLNEGANTVKIANAEIQAFITDATFAKANADMYLGNAEISEVANGTLKATMQLGGEKEIGSDVRGIFAIYEDGKLAAISSATKTLEKYCDEIDVTIENFTAQAGKKYTAKAFMWDGTYSGISIDLAK